MENKNNIRELCNKFKEKEYGLVEFQTRIETALFPDDLQELKHSVLNDLEEIRFTELEEDFYKYGLEVVEKILKQIN